MDFKYIIIPEYASLFAMEKCFGPLHSPLNQPTPTPVDIIKLLLLQTGADKVSIYEVKKTADGTFTKPVQLTLDNYDIPYEKITGTEPSPNEGINISESGEKEPKIVNPTLINTLEPSSEPTADNAPEPTATPEDTAPNDDHSTYMTRSERIAAKKATISDKSTETNN